jgi:hypothetical protein
MPKRHTDEQILAKILILDDLECWIWTGCRHKITGYGCARQMTAHRAVFEILTKTKIPKHLVACHECDFRLCVNPDHIFIGTDADNTLDKCTKGRHPGASKIACSKGHAFNQKNTHIQIRSNGKIQRVCRICRWKNAYACKKRKGKPRK